MVNARHQLRKTKLDVVLPYLKYLTCRCCTREKLHDSYISIANRLSVTSKTEESKDEDEDDDLNFESEDLDSNDEQDEEKISQARKAKRSFYKQHTFDDNHVDVPLDHNNEDPVHKDPYLKYGLGMQAYFQFQADLIKLFCMLVVLAIPSIIIYNTSDGLTTVYDDVNYFAVSSFSNIGFPESKCSRSAIMQNGTDFIGNIIFKCEGKTQISEIYDVGVISSNQSDVLETCYLPNPFNLT